MTGWTRPGVFIQWKGTDVCLDFHCTCGSNGHFDGDFCYTLKCGVCGKVWEMPDELQLREADGNTYEHWRENPQLPDMHDGEQPIDPEKVRMAIGDKYESLLRIAKAYIDECDNMEDHAPVEPTCGECNLGTGPHKQTCALHEARRILGV